MTLAQTMIDTAAAVHDRDGVVVTLLEHGGERRRLKVIANAGGIRPRDGDGGRTARYELVVSAARAHYPNPRVNRDRVIVPAEWLGAETTPANEAAVEMRVAAILGNRADPGASLLRLEKS